MNNWNKRKKSKNGEESSLKIIKLLFVPGCGERRRLERETLSLGWVWGGPCGSFWVGFEIFKILFEFFYLIFLNILMEILIICYKF